MNDIEDFKKELKILLNKYNASIEFDCDSCSDTYGIYDGHIGIEINGKKFRHKHQNYWAITASDVDAYVEDK